jgi:HlyD family secretion protein
MNRTRVLIGAALLAVGATAAGVGFWLRGNPPITVTTEPIRARNLEAVVSVSGKIQPRRLVNISADTSGRVVDLAVNEGDRVTRGQFLLQIDPNSLRTRVASGAASLSAAQASLEQQRQAVETARLQLDQARRVLTRQEELWKQGLTTRETLDKAANDASAAASTLAEREKQVKAQAARLEQERATLESARYDLSKVRIESPIDGIVTRRNIQEGETAVLGTMNNPGTVLLTLADMSVIQAEVEVDETNIPHIANGQPAVIAIDALPDQTFTGRVTEIGNSPIQQPAGSAAGTRQATNFKVVITLEGNIPEVRPGFTCTADITTATRTQAPAVPIPAVAVRELIYDEHGKIVRQPRDPERRETDPDTLVDLPSGHTRKETEGVFMVRDGLVEFVPIRVGIAGDRYFEVLSGVSVGDEVVTGPYNSVRGLRDGDPVQVEDDDE